MRTDIWPKWYAVHTQARCEDKARLNLKRAGYWVFAPFTRETVRMGKKRQPRVVERPWLSRYIFVCLRRETEALGPVNDAVGVSRVVCKRLSGEPLEIPHKVMDEIIELTDGDGLIEKKKAPHPFMGKVGDMVILDGDDPNSALTGFLWRIVSLANLDKHNEISIWLKMLGKEQELSVPVERVAVVSKAA